MVIVPRSGRKQKVLTNKQLTRKIRAMSNQEGVRTKFQAWLYDNVTLTSDTANIKYLDDSQLFNNSYQSIHHYYLAHIKAYTTASNQNEVIRIIYGIDRLYDGENGTSGDILDDTGDPMSPYSEDTVPYREALNKNNEREYRFGIIKDMVLPLRTDGPQAFNVKLPLFNKKTLPDQTDFFPFVLVMTNSATCSIAMGVDYIYTQLEL